MLQQIIEEF